MDFAKREQQILKFWKKNKIFKKSLELRKERPKFTFYDGPPFANGLPHYGHILAMAIKDLITRYKTMRGYYVPRRNGWDCHGLPVEYEAEKELGISGKKEIEKYGIEKFNQYCRKSVFRYTKEWEKTMERMARWIDLKNSYATLDNDYIESVWWVFKQLWEKDLIYKDFRSVPYCPRCATPLSNFEVNLGYKDNVKDPSIWIKFQILNSKFQIPNSKFITYFLVWTTTPWTLPGNAALAVGDDIDYVMINVVASTAMRKTAKPWLTSSFPPSRPEAFIPDQPSEKEEYLILAKECLSIINEEYKIVKEFKGKELVGIEYEPLFEVGPITMGSPDSSSIITTGSLRMTTIHKVVSADFVSIEEGTGIVHIAPGYGEEDFNLGKEKGIPVIVTIDESGKFKEDVKFNHVPRLAIPRVPAPRLKSEKLQIKGKFIKNADKDIIENLKERGLLYKSEIIRHTYPFCWRCEAPVYDYLWPSWFIKVEKIRDALVENNKKIYWMPGHLKEGRFGKWLEGARDWNVSRNRFWGAPIPVWECVDCKKQICIGSVEELRKKFQFSNKFQISNFKSQISSPKFKNNYILLRHVEAENVDKIVSSWPEKKVCELTEKGKKDLTELLKRIKKETLRRAQEISQVDLIFSSDIHRCKKTAEAIAKELGLKVNYDPKIREMDYGVYNGKSVEEYHAFFDNEMERLFNTAPEGGETWIQVKKRMFNFVKRLEKKYKNKIILIISHADPLWMLEGAMKGLSNEEILKLPYPQPGEYTVILRNLIALTSQSRLSFFQNDKARDLHRPYIDEIRLECPKCGGQMKRTPEILDCWFESGAMPYAQWHYPFENQDKFPNLANLHIANLHKFTTNNTNNIREICGKLVNIRDLDIPADFIAEGLDQTRGWFYTLNVLSTALFNQPAFKNVVVNGIVLAEDGKKLSKRLKNYPEPKEIFDTLGVDALRYFLYSSAPIGENYRFSEQRVKEKFQNVILPLWNVYTFWEMYRKKSKVKSQKSKVDLLKDKRLHVIRYKLHILDRWILSKFHQLIKEVTKYLDKYDLTRASRPIEDFIQDLSTWYLRRSRDRIKNVEADLRRSTTQINADSLVVLHYVLITLSKVMAPFTPFIAEEIYQQMTDNRQQTTVVNRKSSVVSRQSSVVSRQSSVESVHLCDWPEADEKLIDEKLLNQMQQIREICELGRRARAEVGIKVRQPLSKLKCQMSNVKINEELLDLIKEELNVKNVIIAPIGDSLPTLAEGWHIIETPKLKIALNIEITSALKEEGMARELIRQINSLRKQVKLTIQDKIILYWQADSEKLKKIFKKFGKQIGKETVSQISDFRFQISDTRFEMSKMDFEKELKIEGEKVWIGIKKYS